MSDLLSRLKLKKSFEFTLHSPIRQVSEGFLKNVDYTRLGPILDFEDLFSSSKNLYKGHLENDQFKIRRKASPFRFHFGNAYAKGRFVSHADKTIVTGEVNGVNTMVRIFLGFFGLIYFIFFITFLTVGTDDGSGFFMILPFIFFHALFVFGIFYLLIRRSVNVMVKEIEREFYFMTRHDKP